jgi:hypothetical protein
MRRVCEATCAAALTFAAAVTGVMGHTQTLDDLQRGQPLIFADAVQAYIYGYPLMMFGMTTRIGTTVSNPNDRLGGAPLNQFGKEPQLPDATFTAVVLPSTTTLYASSFLNLQQEPMILRIPDMQGRFWLMQMLDGWTEVSTKSPGTRQGSKPGEYALVGPDYTGGPIQGVQDVIRMPTNLMWIIGRIYTTGPKDVPNVVSNIYPGLQLVPLSQRSNTNYQAPANLPLQPLADLITPPVNQVAGMDACAFFGGFEAMLRYNLPIPGQDDPIVEKLHRLGLDTIDPNTNMLTAFDCTSMANAGQLATLQQAVVVARTFLQKAPTPPPTKTFWFMQTSVIGEFKDNYLLRAVVAEQALGANNPQDAVYGYTQKDGRGRNLNGNNNYKIHFGVPGTDGGIPPVTTGSPGGFWSVTIYDSNGKLVPSPDPNVNYNAIGGMKVQDHTGCFNSDNSIDLYLQPDPPAGGVAYCNWLPTPKSNDPYIVFLRMYWPTDTILNGGWIPPRIMPN